MKSALNSWQQFAIALGVSTMVVVWDAAVTIRVWVAGTRSRARSPTMVPTFRTERLLSCLLNRLLPRAGSSGEIKDGYYSLTTTGDNDGALAGDYNVAVVAMDIDMASAASSKEEGGRVHEGDPKFIKAVKNAKKLIPDKYGVSETSGLKATVDGAKTIDFPLTD